MTKPKNPKPKKFLYERMATFAWGNRFKVRAWIKAASWTDMGAITIQENITGHLARTLPPEGPSSAAYDLAKLFENVIAAVEVTAADGNGMVVYIDWP